MTFKRILCLYLLYSFGLLHGGFIGNTLVGVPRVKKIGVTVQPIKNIKIGDYVVDLMCRTSGEISTENIYKLGCNSIIPREATERVAGGIVVIYNMARKLAQRSPVPHLISICIFKLVGTCMDINIFLMDCKTVANNLVQESYGFTGSEVIFHLRIKDEDFYASSDQKFYDVDENDWVQIMNLSPSVRLLLLDTYEKALYAAECQLIEKTDTVENIYNLSVEDSVIVVGRNSLITTFK